MHASPASVLSTQQISAATRVTTKVAAAAFGLIGAQGRTCRLPYCIPTRGAFVGLQERREKPRRRGTRDVRYQRQRPAMTGKALIIGYGNPLRGDDGIGQAAAQALTDAPAINCAHVIACHQLMPELAECIATADLVIFVDAAADIQPGSVVVRKIQGTSALSSGLAHTADPVALLDLARRLYGRSSAAFLVTVGISSFALGEGLSEVVAAALPEAVATVRRLVSEHLGDG